ncbi:MULTISPECIES: GbsR/MarR family transcriptional regulator [unclassified Microbacterium]|uniref:GbsR/MarR family transcriptional regulator n=1 Tax=unclassified Microbacterium TaxID=2609290 RepID=UPI000C2C89CE|nr:MULTISPECIES: helix-turn-helix domain-containing protein [unclassified Microbacterium]
MDHPGTEAAEQAAAMLAAAGMPRMPARVMMALVGSPDEGYTAADLADRLGVSAAAVSGAVRYLVSMRLIQRLPRPGDRRDRYDLVDDAWADMITVNAPLYANLAAQMDAIARENVDAPLSVDRARDTADFLRYLAERMPRLASEWRAERATSSSATRDEVPDDERRA